MQQNKEIKDELMLHWNAFLAGNDDGFSKIYEKLADELLSFGTMLTHDHELIRDCIQELFLRIYQNKENLSSVKNIKIYMLIALKNALTNAHKKNQTYRKFIDLHEIEEEPATDSEEERMIIQEYETSIQNTTSIYLSMLTERQRKIICYRYMDGLSLGEISQLLGINYQSVENSIQKSLKKMRNFYLKTGLRI